MEDVVDSSEDCLFWRARFTEAQNDPHAAAGLAREANGRGEHMLALAVAQKALRQLSLVSDPRQAAPLRQQMALALARSGSTEEAMEVLRDSVVAAAEDAETLGLMGRLHKDLAESAATPAEAERHRQQALDFYARGFAVDRSPYCGINTAVLALLTGDRARAHEVAGEVLGLPPEADRLWAVATVAMAQMIRGEAERAREALRLADRAGRRRRSDLAVVRREARRLAAALPDGPDVYDNCFEPVAVAVFHGGGDRLGDTEEIRLRRWLQENRVVCAWSAAASGDEGAFLERAAALGLETCAVLPQALPAENCRKGTERASLVDYLVEDATDPRSAAELARQVATARAVARAASWDVPLLPVSTGPVPSCWADLPQEVFALREAPQEAVGPCAAGSEMRAVLCVWPSRDAAACDGNGGSDLRAVWERHPARCGTVPDGDVPFFFGWPTMSEAAQAAADLRRELAAECALVLHASTRGQADGRLGDWVRRVCPGRIHATGRFADLAALEFRRSFDLCYVGTIDCQAEPLGVRLYHLQPK